MNDIERSLKLASAALGIVELMIDDLHKNYEVGDESDESLGDELLDFRNLLQDTCILLTDTLEEDIADVVLHDWKKYVSDQERK